MSDVCSSYQHDNISENNGKPFIIKNIISYFLLIVIAEMQSQLHSQMEINLILLIERVLGCATPRTH